VQAKHALQHFLNVSIFDWVCDAIFAVACAAFGKIKIDHSIFIFPKAKTCSNVLPELKMAEKHPSASTVQQFSAEEEEKILRMDTSEKWIEFIKSEVDIYHLQAKLSNGGFQKFILSLVRQYEDEETDKSVRKELSDILSDFKFYNFRNSFNGEDNPSISSNIKSLGLDTFFLQSNLFSAMEKCLSLRFCSSEFLMGNEKKYPIPCLEKSQMSQHGSEVEETSQMFYNFLLALFHSYRNNAIHECLAYACHMLREKKFYDNGEMQSKFFYIWGMLAVCLSQLGKSPVLIFSCVEKIKQFVVLKSDELDAILYIQQVYANMGEFQTEKKLMKWLHGEVPVASKFYAKSAQIHIKSALERIVNMMARAFCYQKVERDDRDLIDHTLGKIASLRRFLHQLMSKKNLDSFFASEIENHFRVLDLFEMVLNDIHSAGCCRGHRQNRGTLATLKGKFSDSLDPHDLLYIILLYTQEGDSSTYKVAVKKIIDNKEKRANRKDVLSTANLLFKHATILLCLNSHIPLANMILQQAVDVYQIFHHANLPVVRTLLEVTNNTLQRGSVHAHLNPKCDVDGNVDGDVDEVVTNSDCSVEWLLAADPDLDAWIQEGIASCCRWRKEDTRGCSVEEDVVG